MDKEISEKNEYAYSNGYVLKFEKITGINPHN